VRGILRESDIDEGSVYHVLHSVRVVVVQWLERQTIAISRSSVRLLGVPRSHIHTLLCQEAV